MANVINKIKIDGVEFNVASTAYATCSSSSTDGDKVAYINGTTSSTGVTLVAGLTVHVKFTNSNYVTEPTLSINGTTAKPIKRYGTTAVGATPSTSWSAGETVTLTYDGEYWQLNRSSIDVESLTTYLGALELRMQQLGGTSGGGSGSGGGYDDNYFTAGYWVAVGPQDLVEGDIVVITVETSNGIYVLTTLTSGTAICGLLVNSPEDGILWHEFDFQIDESTGVEEVRFIVEYGEDGLIYFLVYPGTEGKYLYNNGGTSNQAGFTYTKEDAGWVITSRENGYEVYISNPVNNRYLAYYPTGGLWRAYQQSSTYVANNPITIYKWVSTAAPEPQ